MRWEAEAPNTILTDNAQTQVGKTWTKKTSWAKAIRQVKTVPHNQSQAERKI